MPISSENQAVLNSVTVHVHSTYKDTGEISLCTLEQYLTLVHSGKYTWGKAKGTDQYNIVSEDASKGCKTSAVDC